MFKDLNINANNNNSLGDTRIKSSQSNSPSFRATNPNAVDTTPTADTYTPQQQYAPQQMLPQGEQEMDMGTKFIRYGIPSGLALYAGSELFNKANSGEYEKTLVGRLGKLGDRIAASSVMQNSTVDGIKSAGRTYKQKAKDFVLRHPRLRSMYETPTSPECQMVTSFLETQAEHDISKGVNLLEKSILKPTSLKEAGATKEEIRALKQKYGTTITGKIANKEAAIQEFLINKLGRETGHPNPLKGLEPLEREIQSRRLTLQTQGQSVSPEARARLVNEIEVLESRLANLKSRTLERLKCKYLGLNKSEFAALTQKGGVKNAGVVERALLKMKEAAPKGAAKKFSVAYNNLKAASAPATRLGKLLPKMAKLGMRGLTFGGGLANCVLFLGFFIGDAVKNTIDAPKGQKLSTAVHGFNDAISWIIAMPIALKAMHSVNGLKNLGKTKEQVNAYEEARKVFNKNVKNGLLTNRAAYDSELAGLNALKNAGEKPKGLNKVLSKVAKFLSIGLGQTEKYKEAVIPFGEKGFLSSSNIAKYGKNILRKMPNFARNCVGYPLRFALYMFAFQPLVDKLFTGPLNVLFGKPYDPEKIKEEREKAAQNAQQAQAVPQTQDATSGLDNIDPNTLSDDNLVKQALANDGTISSNPQRVNNNGQPVINNNPTGDPNISDYDTVPRTYIPQIDYNNPIPYPDPQDPRFNPDSEQNYDNAKKQYDKTERLIADVEAFINEKNK